MPSTLLRGYNEFITFLTKVQPEEDEIISYIYISCCFFYFFGYVSALFFGEHLAHLVLVVIYIYIYAWQPSRSNNSWPLLKGTSHGSMGEFCGFIRLFHTVVVSFLDPPRGAKWMVRGATKQPLRVQTPFLEGGGFICLCLPLLGKWSILTIFFRMGWNS